MKEIGKKIWVAVEVIIVVYCVLITTLILWKNKYGFPTIGNNTLVVIDSERAENLKEVKKNSLLVIKNSKNYKEGEVVYYYVPKENEYIIRKAKIERIEKEKFIYIKSDNSETQLSMNKVAGKEAKEYKEIGRMIGLVSSQEGFFFLVIFPTLFVFIYLIRELITLLKADDKEEM